MAGVKELREFLKAPREFGIVPFWFLNHYPEEEIVRQQIRDMAQKGVSGVMVHARDGLLGGYLNRHWEDMISCITDEAQKNGLKIWLYDELNYPSGSAGGRVLEKYPQHVMQSLELVYKGKEAPEENFDKLLCSNGIYLGFCIRRQKQYPDYLNDDAAAEFIRHSYSWYKERFGELFSTVIPGEFTDNACGNFGFFRCSIPWTENIEEKFFKSAGLPLDEVLPSLFTETENSPLYRLLFWRFFSDLFLNSFVIRIEKECQKNGICATGHYCLEHGLSEHARQIGDRFKLKQHQQIPGVDMVGRGSYDELGNFPFQTPSIMLALTSSPAYFFHGSRVLCECFGLTLHWQMNLAELRRMTGSLAALGVDIFVLHGLYYSIAGHRKRECIPDFYHNTMWDLLGEWNLFTSRLSALTAHSEHIADTALFYPITSQQAGMELCRTSAADHGTRCNRIDASMLKTGTLLAQNTIPFEAVNDEILAGSAIADGELLIPLPGGGVHHLCSIILPSVWIIEESSFKKLQAFAQAGGKIIGVGEKLSLVFDKDKVRKIQCPPNFYSAFFAAFPDGPSEDAAFVSAVKRGIRHSRLNIKNHCSKLILREWIRKDGQYFAMLHNTSREKINGVKISCDFLPAILDLDTLACSRMTEKSFCKDFDYGETLLLTETAEELPVCCSKRIRQSFWIPEIKKWQIRTAGPNAFRLNDMHCVYRKVERSFKSEFTVRSMPSELGIALDIDPTEKEAAGGEHPFFENGVVFPRNRCRVLINGRQLPDIRRGSSFDSWIYEADILPFVRIGKNTVELIQHCAYRDTNSNVPEPVMLTGCFGVRGNAVVKAPEMLRSTRWDETELKHYSGLIEYTAFLPIPRQYRGRISGLQLDHVFETAELLINGISCGTRIMPPWHFQIDPALSAEKTLKLQLRIRNTPANRWEEPVASGFDGPVRFIVEQHS